MADTMLALAFGLVGCVGLVAALGGLGRILDCYTHNPPPIEYTLGLPPFQDRNASPPLVRHFVGPVERKPGD